MRKDLRYRRHLPAQLRRLQSHNHVVAIIDSFSRNSPRGETGVLGDGVGVKP